MRKYRFPFRKRQSPEAGPCQKATNPNTPTSRSARPSTSPRAYEDRGTSEKVAKSRAWATVNKESGGGEKSGSGRGKAESHASSHKGGKKGGAASASRTAAERSASAKKAAATRKRNAAAKAGS